MAGRQDEASDRSGPARTPIELSRSLARPGASDRPRFEASAMRLLLTETLGAIEGTEAAATAVASLAEATPLEAKRLLSLPEADLRGRLGGTPAQAAHRAAIVRETAASVLGLPFPAAFALETRDARRLLLKLPRATRPTADQLLLRAGRHRVFALRPASLRVALRLGYGAPGKDYSKSYRSAQEALESAMAGAGPEEFLLAADAFEAHGERVCTAEKPACGDCPVARDCASRGPLGTRFA